MEQLRDLIDAYLAHSTRDYVGLWQVAGHIRDSFPDADTSEIREKALPVVRGLVERGLQPFDMLQTGHKDWPEKAPDEVVARVDREWRARKFDRTFKGDPNLADPICWFRRKDSV